MSVKRICIEKLFYQTNNVAVPILDLVGILGNFLRLIHRNSLFISCEEVLSKNQAMYYMHQSKDISSNFFIKIGSTYSQETDPYFLEDNHVEYLLRYRERRWTHVDPLNFGNGQNHFSQRRNTCLCSRLNFLGMNSRSQSYQ